ncbi:hypothetical protein Zm00014a_009268 [Zea mays]|uniref:DUF8039 domain-containing protein n=1 Tax=Zea mays TaxID=4577 RepID=A0A3L6EPG9_MAIZE|nr:hypothetical protein Zm00014a_009268 [Zea mays]
MAERPAKRGAIGSNHPGRTTGVSAYVGLGMGLAQGDGPRKKKRRTTKEYVKRIVDEYEAKFEKLTALCQSMERRLNNSESCSSSKFVDTPDHATHHSVDSLQEVMKCKLVVQIGPQSVVVARGQAYPPKDVVTVHGIERRDDHTKVQVDFVFDNFLEFPLPIPIAGGDMFTLGEAKNSFVLWPKSGIQLAEETTVHAKPQQVPDTSPQPLVSSTLLKRMGKQSQCFHKWYFAMTTPISRRQSATHFMVRYEEHDFLEKSGVYAVEFSDVFHIYNDLALDISLHRSWMLCMRKIDKYRGIVGFLDPEMIILKRINEEADEVEAYIVKALLAQQDKECIFVVCQEGAFGAYVDKKGRHNKNFGRTVIWKHFQGRAGFATCPLLPDEIANVRERLLDFFMNEVIDIGGSCRVEGASYN